MWATSRSAAAAWTGGELLGGTGKYAGVTDAGSRAATLAGAGSAASVPPQHV